MARESFIRDLKEGAIVLDDKSQILDINAAAISLLQPAVSTIGCRAWDVFPWLAAYQENWGSPSEVQLERTPPQYLELRILPFFQEHHPTSRLVLFHDITDRKRSEQDLQQQLQAEQRRRRLLESLYPRMLGLSAELDEAHLMERIASCSTQLLDVKIAELALYDEEEQKLTVAAVHGIDGELVGKSQPGNEGVAGEVIRTGKPFSVENYSQWAHRSQLYEKIPLSAVLGAPLSDGDHLLGVISVAAEHASRSFSTADMDLLALLAQGAALAIQNARLFAQKEHLADIDALTGLYNRRHFYQLGEIEVERAFRYHRPLSAILIDLDHFRNVNEAYGHQAGDQVLKTVVNLCQKMLRKVDLFARFGGEELVILMPETPRDRAFVAAARLRALVEAGPIQIAQDSVKLTISLGVAELEESGGSLEMLLDYAEKAYLQAKQNGRNQVQVYPAR